MLAPQYNNVCLLLHTTFLKIYQNWGGKGNTYFEPQTRDFQFFIPL